MQNLYIRMGKYIGTITMSDRNNLNSATFSSMAYVCLVLIGILTVASCSEAKQKVKPGRLDQKEVLSMVEELVNDFPDNVKAIAELPIPSTDKEFSISLFVDQSQSIQGYIPDSDESGFYDGSNFVALLRALGHQAELDRFNNAKSFGSGLPSGVPETKLPRVVDLMKPNKKDYNLLNNDYASLINEIIRDKSSDRISLILTDGVQSHQTASGGSLMGSTARVLKQWIAAGGYVEVLLSTAPFKGKYFSEELRAHGKKYTLNVSFPKRPFVVFALIPSVELLEEWDAFKKRDRLNNIEFVSYRLPQTVERSSIPATTTAIISFTPRESNELGLLQRESKPYARLDKLTVDPPWSPNLHSALIDRTQLKGTKGRPINKVPVVIEGTAPEGMEIDFDKEQFAAFRPTLSLYERAENNDGVPSSEVGAPKSKENILDRAQQQVAGEGTSAPLDAVEPTTWSLKGALDLRVEDPVMDIIETSKVDAARILRLCYMVPWSGESDLICVLRMETPTVAVEPPQFEMYSTTDDSTPSELSKVYNLATLMGQLAKDETKTAHPAGLILHIRKVE